MEKQTLGKGLMVVGLSLGAFGLLAGPPARDIVVNVPFPERAGVVSERQETADAPRECDPQKGIDTRCSFY